MPPPVLTRVDGILKAGTLEERMQFYSIQCLEIFCVHAFLFISFVSRPRSFMRFYIFTHVTIGRWDSNKDSFRPRTKYSNSSL